MKKIIVSIIALLAAVSLPAQNLTTLYNEAAAAFGAKDFAVAAAKFEQIIADGERDPTAVLLADAAKSALPKCYFMLGGQAMQGAKYAEAEKNFQKATELSKKYGDGKLSALADRWLGKLYQIQAKIPFKNKDFTAASQLLAKGREADPANAEIALKLAWSYGEMALNTGDVGIYTQGMDIFTAMADKTDSLGAENAANAEKGLTLFRDKMVAKLESSRNFDGMAALADSLSVRNAEPALVEQLRAKVAESRQAVSPEEQTSDASDVSDTAEPQPVEVVEISNIPTSDDALQETADSLEMPSSVPADAPVGAAPAPEESAQQ